MSILSLSSPMLYSMVRYNSALWECLDRQTDINLKILFKAPKLELDTLTEIDVDFIVVQKKLFLNVTDE